jgi:pimeloyl-ACP methyl ester carboxylesterase
METKTLEREGGRIAYDVAGDGPLVVCAPGLGDVRGEYRFLRPALVRAGFRVATMDLRGHGDSSAGWRDHSPEAVGGDLLALTEALGGAAFLVGTSFAAASAVWAAAEAPARVRGLVLAGPFVREVPVSLLTRVMLKVLFAPPWGRAAWLAYYKSLYRSTRPADFAEYRAALGASLKRPGHMTALRAMLSASKAACEARLPSVRAPSLVVMGTRDPDFADPRAEATRVAAAIGGEAWMAEGAGHYPHAELPDATAARVLEFLRAHASDGAGTGERAAVARG